jgi:hypothetical protein
MLRSILISLIILSGLSAYAQSDQQEIALEGALEVLIQASFSSVSVSTGPIDKVSLNHVLEVDNEGRADLRKLRLKRENGVLTIIEVLPTAEAMNKEFPDRKGGMLTGAREGGAGIFNDVMVNSLLEVVVPEGIKVRVETIYGGIVATNVAGLISARAKYGKVEIAYTDGNQVPDLDLYSNYGAVDVTLPATAGASLDLLTRYGELMTDLDISIDESLSEAKNFYERVIGSLGTGGSLLKCEAPYGDVYLRQRKTD